MNANWKRTLLIGAGALVVAGGVAAAGWSMAPQIVSAAPTAVGVFGPGGHRGSPRDGAMGLRGAEHGQALADELGITLDELQTAHENVRTKLAEQNGDQTGRRFGPGDEGQMQALLAAELGISVDDLTAALDAVRQTAIDEALANGDITQEQVDRMAAMQALHDTIDKDALTAQALGITVEELQAARDAGTRMDALLEQQGLDHETFATNLQAAHEAAVAQAVADGVITQEQADLLAEDAGHGGPHGGPHGGFGRDEGVGPRGDFDGGRHGFERPGRNGDDGRSDDSQDNGGTLAPATAPAGGQL